MAFKALTNAVDEFAAAVECLGSAGDKWAKGLADLDGAVNEAAGLVNDLKRGRGRDRRPRERLTDPHPEVVLTLVAAGVYRICVRKGAKLEAKEKVVNEASAKAHRLLRLAHRPLKRIVVGRAISNIANPVMRSYVGSSLPPNSQFEYSTPFTKSKIIPPSKQLEKCPVPFRNAMQYALADGGVAAALESLDEKDQFEAVHQAITNGYKSFTTHKCRKLKKQKQLKKIEK